MTIHRSFAAAALALACLLPAPRPSAAQAAGTDGDTDAVLATVHALFDAMRAKDAAALEGVFLPGARINTTALREGETVVGETTAADFIRTIAGAEAHLDERIWGEEVRVERPLATVWTEYLFLVDGEVSHCGVDAFDLVLDGGTWKILQITDTQRREGCPEVPGG